MENYFDCFFFCYFSGKVNWWSDIILTAKVYNKRNTSTYNNKRNRKQIMYLPYTAWIQLISKRSWDKIFLIFVHLYRASLERLSHLENLGGKIIRLQLSNDVISLYLLVKISFATLTASINFKGKADVLIVCTNKI